jgi:hypothetical protein
MPSSFIHVSTDDLRPLRQKPNATLRFPSAFPVAGGLDIQGSSCKMNGKEAGRTKNCCPRTCQAVMSTVKNGFLTVFGILKGRLIATVSLLNATLFDSDWLRYSS